MFYWFLLALLGFAGAAVFFAVLHYDEIVDWFRPRLEDEIDEAHVGITILKHLDSGNYQLVQGIFDTQSEEVVEHRTLEAEEVDQQLVSAHDANGVCVWT